MLCVAPLQLTASSNNIPRVRIYNLFDFSSEILMPTELGARVGMCILLHKENLCVKSPSIHVSCINSEG